MIQTLQYNNMFLIFQFENNTPREKGGWLGVSGPCILH